MARRKSKPALRGGTNEPVINIPEELKEELKEITGLDPVEEIKEIVEKVKQPEQPIEEVKVDVLIDPIDELVPVQPMEAPDGTGPLSSMDVVYDDVVEVLPQKKWSAEQMKLYQRTGILPK